MLIVTNATIITSVTVRHTISPFLNKREVKVFVKKLAFDHRFSKYSQQFMTKYCIWEKRHSLFHCKKSCHLDIYLFHSIHSTLWQMMSEQVLLREYKT
jgi:hypothetical protein